MVVSGKSMSFETCTTCVGAQRSVETWMHHLSEFHPLPEEWLSEKVCRLNGEAAQRPYTSITESKKKRKKEYIPRPLNSFMIFARHMRRSILEIFSEASNSDISKQLGEVWRNLSMSVKTQYNTEATRLAKIHLNEFPNYKYQPKKKVKQNLQTTSSHGSSSTVNTTTNSANIHHHHNNNHHHSHHNSQHHYGNHIYQSNMGNLNHHNFSNQQQSFQQMPRLTSMSAGNNSSRGIFELSVIPLSIATEGIEARPWKTFSLSNSRPNSSNVSVTGEDVKPYINNQDPITHYNLRLVASSGDSVGPPSDVAMETTVVTNGSGTNVYSSASDINQLQHSISMSNCDYFAHLNDCSGYAGLNLETAFGDLPHSTLADDLLESATTTSGEGMDSFTGIHMIKREDDFNDYKDDKHYSSQTPSSVLSDDMMNLLPLNFSGSPDDAGLSFDTQLGFNDQLPNLVSWVGSKF